MVNFDRYVTAFSTRVKSVAATTSPKIRGLATASPKARAIAAGGALAVVTGVAAPIALTQSGHDTSPDVAMATAEHASPQASGPQSSDPQSSNPQSSGPQSSDPQSSGKASSAATEAPSKPDAKVDSMAPADNQLHPVGVQGSQSDVALGADQMKNAEKIVAAGKAMGLPPRAWVIALATSMQESKLHNLGDLGSSNDHDSLGLFQQRPTSGWGSPDQLQDPTYASKAFYKSLTQVKGWDKMSLTDAAQKVQVSAFGDAYAQWEAKAGDVVDSMYGQGPLADHKSG